MLYKKNKEKELDMELFRAPTAEYRGTPFWAWNGTLDRDQLLRQIDYFKEMGFGGFHIHSRTGMASPYLDKEFMEHVKACTEKAKQEEMLAWLYDEDRYPSGVAGGMVTKEKKYCYKYLSLMRTAPAAYLSKEEAYEQGKPYFLAAYDVLLDEQGMLADYRRIGVEEEAKGLKWYASVHTDQGQPRYNGEGYIDALDQEAIGKFIEITYGAYAEAVGEEFGKTVPAIFTDEPSCCCRLPQHEIPFAKSEGEICTTWSRYFEEKYQARYGEDLLDKLPELFWRAADRSDSQTKYRYYDFCAEEFYNCFSKQCGDWCDQHGIAFTGHIYEEPTLEGQVYSVGDLMRQYRAFTIPGMDMLCNRLELTTAKQVQSAVHQMDKEGMMSELYGVTGWHYDFRGHKFQGDWQAALGVTVRVPHLSWMSMGGEAKRDYPASLFYQAPWYKEYPYLEDHYARLNTVLTRGKPVVKVGVIHPVESFWITTGPNDQTASARKALEENLQTITGWLLEEHQDFNYIDESLLAVLGKEETPRKVGAMDYDAILIPACLTLRKTTRAYLERFAAAGGAVLFMGDLPAYTDGVLDPKPALCKGAKQIAFDKTAMQKELEPFRTVDLRYMNGKSADRMLYQMRKDGEDLWLFTAYFKEPPMPSIIGQQGTKVPTGERVELTIKGEYQPRIYDTFSGKVLPVTFRHEGGATIVSYEFFDSDSLLLRFSAPHFHEFTLQPAEKLPLKRVDYKQKVAYRREEDNVLVLDLAEYRLDNEEWQPCEEILRLDDILRKRLGYALRTAKFVQPWVVPVEEAEHTASVRYTVESALRLKNIKLALEDADRATIFWNGKAVSNQPIGYYVDESIQTVALPDVKKGKNVLEITWPIGKRSNLEACYLLGDFDVTLQGVNAVLTAPSKEIGFGSITHQGMPFYGGNLTYQLPFDAPAECDLSVHIGKYSGALCKVSLDGGEAVPVAFAPYNATFKKLQKGAHTLEITLFGTRTNTFGSLHNCADLIEWYGPTAWRTVGDNWCYEYQLKGQGILISPKLELNR